VTWSNSTFRTLIFVCTWPLLEITSQFSFRFAFLSTFRLQTRRKIRRILTLHQANAPTLAPFNKEDKILIKSLYECKGYKVCVPVIYYAEMFAVFPSSVERLNQKMLLYLRRLNVARERTRLP